MTILLSFIIGFMPIFLMGLTTDQIIQKVYDSSNTALRVNVVVGGGGTPTGCTNTNGNPLSCPGLTASNDSSVGLTVGVSPTALTWKNSGGYIEITLDGGEINDMETAGGQTYWDFFTSVAGGINVSITSNGAASSNPGIFNTPSAASISFNGASYVGNQTGETFHLVENSVDSVQLTNGGAGAGHLLVLDLKTTGAATGKKVVCVDTTTGQLYASSSGTDCSN